MKRKRWLIPFLLFVMVVCLMVQPAMAEVYLVNDRPLNLLGYITQGASYNLSDENYYNEEGFNSALMNLFIECDYKPTNDSTLYLSNMLTVDWIYDIKDSDNSWNNKLFDESDRQQVDDEYWQILKEAHVTWTPSTTEGASFFFRVGKQIVSWGEMDGDRIMDQINPLDTSRGPADVEFETSIIPIWLLRAVYNPWIDSPWLNDFGIEFVFNPNADFIPNKDLGPGTDKFGIWAPEVYIPMGMGLPAPFDYMYMGSMVTDIDEPDDWDSDFFEYGVKFTALINEWFITLNGFYGRENAPVLKGAPVMPIMDMAYDGRMIMHPVMQGKYPRQKFVGLTISHDFTSIFSTALGGVSPIMRLEALYQFDKTYTTNRDPWGMGEFEKFNRLRFGLGFDWKIKLRFIPQWAGFAISPQVFYSKIMDYPSYGMFAGEEEESFAYTLMIYTTYFNAKLMPMVFWWHDHDFDSDFLMLKATYNYDQHWDYSVGAVFFNGREEGFGYEVFDNKDTLFFKISYKFG